jgi:phosphate starvation-inducible PhoH-like protein
LNKTLIQHELILEPNDARRLSELSGPLHQHLKQIESHLGITLNARGNVFNLSGEESSVAKAIDILHTLYEETLNQDTLNAENVYMVLRGADTDIKTASPLNDEEVVLLTKRGSIKPRGKNQQHYVRSLLQYDINFGVGPAGTGKTWLAVAAAVHLLEKDEISRIMLVRPAVEAGEKLGFLPGDLVEKINPYLRPLYDALYEMLGFERVAKLIERQVIEIAPLAYMRGRTLNNAFIILDEGQNTTPEQMKMFLTRLGFGSKAVITGDITQVDLPKGQPSGLAHAIQVLDNVKGIHITRFTSKDVVRHKLVQAIVEAYESFDKPRGNTP